MFEDLTTYQIIVLISMFVGGYIKLKLDQNAVESKFMSEIIELKLKLRTHEDQTEDIKKKLEALLKAVDDIKLLLARNQLDK
jgi:hypothetical protein